MISIQNVATDSSPREWGKSKLVWRTLQYVPVNADFRTALDAERCRCDRTGPRHINKKWSFFCVPQLNWYGREWWCIIPQSVTRIVCRHPKEEERSSNIDASFTRRDWICSLPVTQSLRPRSYRKVFAKRFAVVVELYYDANMFCVEIRKAEGW